MTRMTRSMVLGGVLLTVAFGTTASAQLPSLGGLMRDKLEHSQSLLEAMVLSDFDTVESLAGALVRVSEVSAWSSSQEPEYLNAATDFRDVAGVLIEEARAADIDAVVDSYTDMTRACVRCHRFMSRARQAR